MLEKVNLNTALISGMLDLEGRKRNLVTRKPEWLDKYHRWRGIKGAVKELLGGEIFIDYWRKSIHSRGVNCSELSICFIFTHARQDRGMYLRRPPLHKSPVNILCNRF
jgi:hypothetical protein